MKKMMLVLLAILYSVASIAGGYQVRLQGNKQTGIGLIGTPLVYGSSSIFYNPGSLSFMENNWHFELGANAILATAAFQKSKSNYQAETSNPMSTPFDVYAAARVAKWITVGVGVYTPYGSSAAWDENWAGKLLIQDISLQAIFIQPTVSFNIKDVIGIGGGLIYAMGNFELNRALNYSGDATASLKGSSSAIGFNLGLFVKAGDRVTLGAGYRSEMTLSVSDGDASFSLPPSLLTQIPAENKFEADLPLPQNVDFGISVQASEKVLIAFEMNWINWGVYDSLSFTFDEAGELLNSSNPRLYKDSFIPRIGVQWDVNKVFTLRGGLYYDPAPTHKDYFSPETVSLNSVAYTLGLSIMPVEGLSIDISWLNLFGEKSTMNYTPDNFEGVYQTITYIPGLGISYTF
ncbi:MAG: outer membrane protein transport protein [bacterium]|jgi:long-chain fatty acid transport protein